MIFPARHPGTPTAKLATAMRTRHLALVRASPGRLSGPA